MARQQADAKSPTLPPQPCNSLQGFPNPEDQTMRIGEPVPPQRLRRRDHPLLRARGVARCPQREDNGWSPLRRPASRAARLRAPLPSRWGLACPMYGGCGFPAQSGDGVWRYRHAARPPDRPDSTPNGGALEALEALVRAGATYLREPQPASGQRSAAFSRSCGAGGPKGSLRISQSTALMHAV